MQALGEVRIEDLVPKLPHEVRIVTQGGVEAHGEATGGPSEFSDRRDVVASPDTRFDRFRNFPKPVVPQVPKWVLGVVGSSARTEFDQQLPERILDRGERHEPRLAVLETAKREQD